MAQLRPALSLRHVRFAATATGGSMTIMKARSCPTPQPAKIRLGSIANFNRPFVLRSSTVRDPQSGSACGR